MKILQTDRSKFLTIMAIILLGLFSLTIFAQEKGESKSKLDKLKGKVEKITVKVDGEDVVFEGKDAKELTEKIKAGKRIKIFTSEDLEEVEECDGNVMVISSKSKIDDFDSKSDGVKKKIKVEVNDGKKVLTVTTTKDGKEEIKTYEGDEADKFLESEDGLTNVWISADGKDGKSKDHMIYFNRKMGGKKMSKHGCDCCCGGCKMEITSMHGKTPHKMMMMMKSEKNDDKDVEVIIEKKEKTKTEKK